MLKKIVAFTLLFAVYALHCFGQFEERDMTNGAKVGDMAPPLTVVKWVRGKGVATFKKGMVYVVEFGFLSCAPCQASIPHLNKIAQKYAGKVQVLSIDIWENASEDTNDLSYIKRVEQYAVKMGGKIKFSLAADVPNQMTARTWGGGAPKAFIIDQQGKIAWIGSPIEMDPIISETLDGNIDSKSVESKQEQDQNYINACLVRLWQDMDEKKYSLAINGIDDLISKYPYKYYLYYQKFRMLSMEEPKAADSLGDWMLNRKQNGFDALWNLMCAEIMLRPKPNLELAMRLADRAMTISEYPPFLASILDRKAEIFFKMGNVAKAIDTQQLAINYLQPFSSEQGFHKEFIGLENGLKVYYKAKMETQSSSRAKF
jgi:thiol-disulfide isomerase/thioredoxin